MKEYLDELSGLQQKIIASAGILLFAGLMIFQFVPMGYIQADVPISEGSENEKIGLKISTTMTQPATARQIINSANGCELPSGETVDCRGSFDPSAVLETMDYYSN